MFSTKFGKSRKAVEAKVFNLVQAQREALLDAQGYAVQNVADLKRYVTA